MDLIGLTLLLSFMAAVSEPASYSPDCRDKEMVCSVLVHSMPNFCQMGAHAKYAAENCQKTCGFCKVRPTSFEHGTNLIWAQTPYVKVYSVSRLVAIPDDPGTWVANRKPQVTYISAPHFTWEFKALGFHWEDQTLYWSESMNKKIQSLVLNGSTDTNTLFSGTSPEVYGIAVDWLSRNLYFTDSLYNWIMMTASKPGLPAYKIVVQDKLDSPHGVAVHPQKGYLIWSDWGTRPRIEIADLLGQNRRTLVERDISRPRGLTIDYSKNALYWVDTMKATVEVVLFNGQGRRVIHKEEGTSFYGVALFKNFIFVTERSRGMLKVFDKSQSVVSFTLGNVPSDIVMYDGSQQPGNSTDCEDLGCEHFCVLDPLTGPNCFCGEGYIGEDPQNKSCKPSMKFVHPSHIYAIRDSICQYPANLADMSLSNVTLDSQCFLEDGQGYMTLAFDARENMLYYFGNNTKTISRIPLEMGGKGTVLTGGTGIVQGMALDWVAGNLYWTDSSSGVIKVAKKSGSFQSVVLEKLDNPFGIAVHPGRGQIYWTDHGHLPDVGGKVERANLDGTERDLIMGDNVGQPNHLFIDFEKDCLYWADSILHHVRKYDLETERITVIYEQANVKFYGLSFFKDFILWTDTEDLNGIHIARMDKKEKVRGIIHPRNGLAADLITFDISNQPKLNSSCAEGTNKCSQLCLATASLTAQCYCGTGYELALDGFTCHSTPVYDNFLLVNDAYQRQIFQVNVKNAVVGVIDLQPRHEPIALAYDPLNFNVYWSDNKQNLIKEANIDGNYEKEVVLFNNASMCDGLVVDYINRLLFFTDTGNNVIGVVSLRNFNLMTYIHRTGLDQPRDIVVSPNEGIIYWSDWGSSAKIEKSYMDGSGRETLVSFDSAAWPNGLALDYKENTLYWVDAHMDTINMIDLATKDITKLREEPGAHYFSVEVMGKYLYVADWKKNYLRRMDKRGGPLTQFGPAKFTRMYGIKGYNSSESFVGMSVCFSSVCEHLCLPKENNQFTCKCAEGYIERNFRCDKENITQSPTLPPFTTLFTTKAPEQSTTVISSTTIKTTTIKTTPEIQTTEPTTQSIHIPTTQSAIITKIPVAMTTNTGNDNSTTDETDINTTIKPIVDYVTDIAKSSSNKAVSSGLSTAVMALIIASIIIVIAVVVIVAVLYRRKYRYRINHGKLIEDTPPNDFYKIAYPARGEDAVTFGTGTGIENPTYDCLHDPSNNVMTNSNSNNEST